MAIVTEMYTNALQHYSFIGTKYDGKVVLKIRMFSNISSYITWKKGDN